jgi:hypothetical protein
MLVAATSARATKGEARAFLVPREEYDVGSQRGFVVDPAKHQEVPFPTPRSVMPLTT